MRRLIIIAALLSLPLAPLSALAQDAPAPAPDAAAPVPNAGADIDNGLDMPAPPPPQTAPDISEYDHVPEGILISPEADTKSTEAAPANELPPSQSLGQMPGVYEIPGVPQAEENQSALNMDQIMLAYSRGQFDVALKNLEPMAANKQHPAEELLGVMYLNGQGTDKNPVKALDLFSRAAEAGLPLSEHYAGTMYFTGQGIDIADPIRGLMWVEISILHYADGPEKDRAERDRDAIFAKTTRMERNRATEMVREWLQARGEEHLLDIQQQ